MPTCNIINVNQIKVTDLSRYSSLRTRDLFLTIESGSSNNFFSRKSTFGDLVNLFSKVSSSYSGSFSGSIKSKGTFTGSISGALKGKVSGSASGSFFGFYIGSGKITGSFTGSFKGLSTGKSRTTGSYTGSFKGLTTGKSLTSGSLTGSFRGKSSGSISGSIFGRVVSKNGKITGSLSGSFFGQIISKNIKASGSINGNLYGFVSASSDYNDNQKAGFYGTASWAKLSEYSILADVSIGNPTGTGTSNYSAYWSDASTLAGNDYIRRATTMTSVGGGWSTTLGRTVLTRPLNVGTQGVYGSGNVGQHLIQFSSSTVSQPRVDLYDIGLQISNNYIRTAASFCVFYSGSFDAGAYSGYGRDGILRPSTQEKSGITGFTTLVARQRLLGVGHFYQASNVAAQLHVHLSSSFGWPDHTIEGGGYSSGYKPNKNVFLITSGSSFTKLLRVSGSGQLDVKGDIVAFSTFATSDQRLKENIVTLENGLDKINEINPVQFSWKHNNKKDYGVIAQEVEKIYPEFVAENMDGYKVVNYNSIIALLIKSVQELKREIEQIKNK